MTCTYCAQPSTYHGFCRNCQDVTSACDAHLCELRQGCFVCGASWPDGAIRAVAAPHTNMLVDQDNSVASATQQEDQNEDVIFQEEKQEEVGAEPVATTLSFSQNAPSVVQPLNNLQSQTLSNPNSSLASAPGSTTSCQHRQTPPTVEWVSGTSNLVHDVAICRDTIAQFGNGFARMREAEAGLQASTGIKIQDRAAVAGSPNNALGELRLLVSNCDCAYRQIAVNFVDTAGRQLLYRSTGGRVMEYFTDDTGESKKRPKTASAGGNEYVYAGAFSFCQEVSRDAQVRWVDEHDGAYMIAIMEVVGKAGEHFHHSEQSFFRLLYEYAAELPRMIYDKLAQDQGEFVARSPLTLHVVSVDIFTTRAACDNCAHSSGVVLEKSGHFFSKFAAALGGKFATAPGLSNLVRIDCAVRHNNTPDQATSSTMPVAARKTVHALPPKGTASTSDLDGLHLVRMPLPVKVNAAQFILLAGGDKRHWTKIKIHINQLSQLGTRITATSEIFPEIKNHLGILINGTPQNARSAIAPQPETFLLVALDLIKQIQGKAELDGQNAHLANLGINTSPVRERVLQVFRCGAQGNLTYQKILSIIIRHYRQFGFVSLAVCQSEILEALKDSRKLKFSDIFPLSNNQAIGFHQEVTHRFDPVVQVVKQHVTAEIKEYFRSQNTGYKEDALALAQDFDLMTEYDAAQNDSAAASSAPSTSSSSSSQQATSALNDEL